MLRKFRSPAAKLAALAVGALVMTLGVSAALATSDSGTQNPDVTVSVSLSPDVVTVGDTVTATASVTNNTNRRQKFVVKATLTEPDGSSYSQSTTVRLDPGQTDSLTRSVVIDAGTPKGQYSLRVSARNNNGASSATATTTVQ